MRASIEAGPATRAAMGPDGTAHTTAEPVFVDPQRAGLPAQTAQMAQPSGQVALTHRIIDLPEKAFQVASHMHGLWENTPNATRQPLVARGLADPPPALIADGEGQRAWSTLGIS